MKEPTSFYDLFGTSAGADTIRKYLAVVDTIAVSLGARTTLTRDVVYSTMAELIRDGANDGWIPERDREYFHFLAREFDRAADSLQLAPTAMETPELVRDLMPTQSTNAFEFHSDLMRLIGTLARQLHAEQTDRDGVMGQLTWAETVKMAARALQTLQKGLSFNGVRSRIINQVEMELWDWAKSLGEVRVSGTLGDPSVAYDPSAENPWSQAGS